MGMISDLTDARNMEGHTGSEIKRVRKYKVSQKEGNPESMGYGQVMSFMVMS
jgi:hypothetical protein